MINDFTGTKNVTITDFTISTNTSMNSFDNGRSVSSEVYFYALDKNDLPQDYNLYKNNNSDPGYLIGSASTSTLTSNNSLTTITNTDYILGLLFLTKKQLIDHFLHKLQRSVLLIALHKVYNSVIIYAIL